MDPQGNATMGSGLDKHQLDKSVMDVLLGDCPVDDALLRSAPNTFDVLPANGGLTLAEIRLMQMDRKEFRLREILDELLSNLVFSQLNQAAT